MSERKQDGRSDAIPSKPATSREDFKQHPNQPAAAWDDEEVKCRREDWAGPEGQPPDTERPVADEDDPQLRSHHLETTGDARATARMLRIKPIEEI